MTVSVIVFWSEQIPPPGHDLLLWALEILNWALHEGAQLCANLLRGSVPSQFHMRGSQSVYALGAGVLHTSCGITCPAWC